MRSSRSGSGVGVVAIIFKVVVGVVVVAVALVFLVVPVVVGRTVVAVGVAFLFAVAGSVSSSRKSRSNSRTCSRGRRSRRIAE